MAASRTAHAVAVAPVLVVVRADGLVISQESIVDPGTPAPRTPDSPYRELDVALYRTPTASHDQLVVSTRTDPTFSGTVDHRTLPVGTERWLMLTTPIEPLGGSFTRSVPWMILLCWAAVRLSSVPARPSRP